MTLEFEETSSLQVLSTVTADATITAFFGLFSFDGSIHDALFPPGLFKTKVAAAANLLDVLFMLLLRSTLAISAVMGTRQCVSRIGLFLVFGLHCSMATWMATKAVLAGAYVNDVLDISIPGSDATIHVWWLYITLIMSAVFGFAEHSLCVAWAATFRGDRWIEMSQYRGSLFRQHNALAHQEPLLRRPRSIPAHISGLVTSSGRLIDTSDPLA